MFSLCRSSPSSIIDATAAMAAGAAAAFGRTRAEVATCTSSSSASSCCFQAGLRIARLGRPDAVTPGEAVTEGEAAAAPAEAEAAAATWAPAPPPRFGGRMEAIAATAPVADGTLAAMTVTCPSCDILELLREWCPMRRSPTAAACPWCSSSSMKSCVDDLPTCSFEDSLNGDGDRRLCVPGEGERPWFGGGRTRELVTCACRCKPKLPPACRWLCWWWPPLNPFPPPLRECL